MLDSSSRIALVADLHGHADILARALKICELERAEAIVFLGDMIDRDDQADACVSLLSGWRARFPTHLVEVCDRGHLIPTDNPNGLFAAVRPFLLENGK